MEIILIVELVIVKIGILIFSDGENNSIVTNK